MGGVAGLAGVNAMCCVHAVGRLSLGGFCLVWVMGCGVVGFGVVGVAAGLG
jgi:hypothetical protein